MFDAPLQADRVEALLDPVAAAHDGDVVLALDLALDRRRRDEDARARVAEGLGQRAILELTRELGADRVLLEPGIERAPQRRTLGGKEQRARR